MSICDIFDRIRNQCIECDKLGFDTKYFINRMDELLKEINKTKCEIKVEDIIEKEELDYACVFNLLNEVSETLHKSSDFMKIIRQVIHKQQMNAWDFSDAVIKFHFTGVRVTEHERCKEGEALEYCIFCCGEPIYPEDGKGNVITGRNVIVQNNALEWTHNELTKIMLHPLANGSLRWDDCKSLMGKVFLTMRSVKEVKFHAHKRLNYRAMDNNIIALRFLYEKDMKDHPPRNIDKPSIPYKAWDLQAALLSSVQTVALNKLEVSFYEKIDCISINYQSPNHPWHAMKAETATVCFYYNDVNDVFSDYMEYLNDVTNEKFIKNKYLFSNEILDIFPNLKSIYMTD
eukprot:503319_1